jgi:hypothetical protein
LQLTDEMSGFMGKDPNKALVPFQLGAVLVEREPPVPLIIFDTAAAELELPAATSPTVPDRLAAGAMF